MAKKKTSENFEHSITTLEHVVQTLEKGDLKLEEALQKFEEGMKLAHACHLALETAKQHVFELTDAQGEWLLTPFESQTSGEDNSDV